MPSLNDHFDDIVLPALTEYLEAEATLTLSAAGGPSPQLAAARVLVMRRARTAAIELHQLADYAAKLSGTLTVPADVRAAVQRHCVFLRGNTPTADIDLLRDVADAFKHHTLDRKSASVNGADAMIASATGYSVLFFGEGKFGGVEQVVVTQKDGNQRALSSVLQNATDAWRMHLNRSLPDIGDYSA